MTLTVGRIGVAAANGGDAYTFTGPETVTQEGREVTVTGHIYDVTQPDGLWRAQQIIELNDIDGDVVPVTFSDAAGMDGYYRVLSASCDYRHAGSSTTDVWAPWSIQLEAVRNYRRPRIDLAAGYGLMPNGHSITAFDAVVGFPGPVVDAYPPFVPDSSGNRAVSEGSSAVILIDSGLTSSGLTGTGRLVIPAASYYHAGCRVEHDVDGAGTWRQPVGLHDFPASGKLRITNGLVRATITYGTALTSDLSVEWWDGSWTSPVEFYLEGVGTHDELVYYAASVIRNTAEQVTVRFSTIASSFTDGMADVTFSVRRGSRWVSAYAESAVAPTTGWRLGYSTSTGSADITGGVRRLLDNGGNREILAGQYATTKDTSNGRVTTVSIKAALFGIGNEIGGSGATGQNTAANQIEEWFCSISERAVVVAG